MPEQIRYRVSRPEEPVTTISVLATKNILNIAANYDKLQRLDELQLQGITVGAYGVKGVATVQPATEEEAYRVTFPLTKFGQRRRDDFRMNDIISTMRTLTAIERAARLFINDPEDQPRILSFRSSQNRFSDGSMDLSVRIMKPPYGDKYVACEATASMRQVARAIRYAHHSEWSKAKNEKHLDDNVYADYQREKGATLKTNPRGSCSIGTEEMWYVAADPRIELTARKLYSPEQQLICLAGAIAIAECAEG